jgi:hypothetical protein
MAREREAPAGWTPAGAPQADDRLGSQMIALDDTHGTPEVKTGAADDVEALEALAVAWRWALEHNRPRLARILAARSAARIMASAR